MLKELLEYVFNEARDSFHPKPHVRKMGGRRQIVTICGEDVEELLEPSSLLRVAQSVESVGMLVKQFGGKKATAFVSDDGVVVVLDDEDRQETINMPFEHSPQFNSMMSLAGGYRQRELIKVLRTQLAGCVNHEGIVALIRQVEFGIHNQARGKVGHQDESLGRSVDKQVRAKAGEIPEELNLTLPLYSTPRDVPSSIDIVVAVDIDIDNEKIALIPKGDTLNSEIDRVRAAIVSALTAHVGDECLVVEGSCTNLEL